MTGRAGLPGPGVRAAGLALLLATGLAAGPAAGQGPAPEPLPDLETRAPRAAWMGIRGTPGVAVVEVVANGPAARTGLKAGDVLISVDGRSTIEDGGLLGYLAERRPGDVVKLQLMRAGEDLELALTLGEFPLELLSQRPEPRRPAAPEAPKPPQLPPEAAGRPGADLRWLGAEERPFLGVRLQELSPGLADYFGLPEGAQGLLVEHVHEDGPARSAGLRAGDVLLRLDGRPVASMTEVGELLRERSVGDRVALAWSREGRETRAEAVLGARKKDIWVVSPPESARAERTAARRLELQARRRALQEQIERLEAERRSIELGLEALAAGR